MQKVNKGEWSELYAFFHLLKSGRLYAADENVNRIDNIFFPIIKLLRNEGIEHVQCDYFTGKDICIYKNGVLIERISNESLIPAVDILYRKILSGGDAAFEIPEIEEYMDKFHITQVKAPSTEKIDLSMQIHDIHTGYNPTVGFSIKSDMGSAPTLLNPGKNTRFRYEIRGFSDSDMNEVNSITKDNFREYMKERCRILFSKATEVKFSKVLDETFEDNLMMVDSMLPEIYGECILAHYKYIANNLSDINDLCQVLAHFNPLGYRRTDMYRFKIKKLLCSSALGMTPGTAWNGLDTATGGYIIVKKDGDVVCYHLYNRNFFEEYLVNNTKLDRPSATRYDYGYVYKEANHYYIDFNVQIRFKNSDSTRKRNNPLEEILSK